MDKTLEDGTLPPYGAIVELRDNQMQADMNGERVTVSRQALDEVLAYVAACIAQPSPVDNRKDARHE